GALQTFLPSPPRRASDRELLEPLGIKVVHALPGVGQNLQDHLEVYIQHACKQPISFNPALKLYNRPKIGLQWLLGKKGPAATNQDRKSTRLNSSHVKISY